MHCRKKPSKRNCTGTIFLFASGGCDLNPAIFGMCTACLEVDLATFTKFTSSNSAPLL